MLRFKTLLIESQYINVLGQYSSYVDGTVIVEPDEQIARSMLDDYKTKGINQITIYKHSSGKKQLEFFKGPFVMKEQFGLLVFQKIR
ncbi:hypothetical protein [Thalassobacillus sp. CUG 92003]|uniref:hypothetical protein n=1 Tax=Thalassobacillus sp. CUG 92003 TaxID=2736641 RepID=UPI0015E63D61|nr:hypothetical protein [Thalassobacillus sp. CUG 92003]